MSSFLLPQFFTLYRALPEDVRQRARQAYAIFQQNPHHRVFLEPHHSFSTESPVPK
jgi:hypothetical protein